MRQLTRLIRYVAPYWWQLLSSVLLMALVGLLDAFRVLLVGPVLDRVLNPSSGSSNIRLFTIPKTDHNVYLQQSCRRSFTMHGRSLHLPWSRRQF
jgi:ATP-binding cassette, subfamily B, bacterial MsbA